MNNENAIRYLVNSYRAISKKCHTIHNFGYMVFIAMLATGGLSGVFMVTADIVVAQAPDNNFSDSKENFMEPKALFRMESKTFFTVEIYPKSSLVTGPRNDWHVPYTTDGTNLVIYIVRTEPPPQFTLGGDSKEILSVSGGDSTEDLWLEAPQEGLDISENEITITEWSRLALLTGSSETIYFSSNGSGVLKIRKRNKKLISDNQETSFHGTARFHFTDPSYKRMGQPPEEFIDWTFLLNEREGALLFSIKESNE